MHMIIGTVNCARPLGLIERDIRYASGSFSDAAFPTWRGSPTTREIMLECVGDKETHELDPQSQYTFLSLAAFPEMIVVWEKRYLSEKSDKTHILLAIGGSYFCGVHLVAASVLVEPHLRESIRMLIGAQEAAKEGEALWFDSATPADLFRRDVAIFEPA